MQNLTWTLALFWTLAGVWHGWHLWRWRRLPKAGNPLPADAGRQPFPAETAPFVSVLVPARNEADRMLAPCVRSILAQDYPRFEIVAVDDCSTDETGDVLRAMAGEAWRLRVLAGREPPAGWVGKTWALEQAREHARGDWLLVVDADTQLAPTLLSDAVACAQTEHWDALTLLPLLGTDVFAARAALPVYEWVVTFGLPFVHRDGAGGERASACGAFFLLRREALEAVGGFGGVRFFVAEDIALARRLKAAGFRLSYQRATDRFWTPHYRNAREIGRGFAKNLWTPAFGTGRGLLLAALLFALALGPWAGLLAGHPAAAAAQLVAFAPAYAGPRRGGSLSPPGKGLLPWRAVFAPLVLAAIGGLLVANIARVRAGRGLLWKDRALHTEKK